MHPTHRGRSVNVMLLGGEYWDSQPRLSQEARLEERVPWH
jgi:hypothetical protein